jgi:hypothetical protein
MDTFKIGEVCLVIKGDFLGHEVTILSELDVIDGWLLSGQRVCEEGYYVEIHGVSNPSPGYRWAAGHYCLRRKPPKATPREEVGEWELCPWQPTKVLEDGR